MSLGTALNAAMTGLQISARGTQVVADNIANADTPGYGVRSVTQTARAIGGQGSGVLFRGIARDSDPALLASLRDARAAQAMTSQKAAFWSELETGLGSEGAQSGLAARMTALDTALAQAVVSPDNTAALAQVAQAAQAMILGFADGAATIAAARDRADHAIAQDVDTLNRALARIATLNKDIQRQGIVGGSPNALIDQRDVLIDQVAEILPVREIPRDDGRVMLVARDGTILLDQNAVTFGFQRNPQPQPTDTVATGTLSAVMLGNRQISAGSMLLGQGRLAGALAVRDTESPNAQAALDALAADLVQRFAGPQADPTLAPGALGLFRDSAAAALPVHAVGLSGRLALSGDIDPADTGTLWRLRDGLGAAAPGPVGASARLSGLRDAFAQPTALATGQARRDLHGHAADLTTFVSQMRVSGEEQLALDVARADLLAEKRAAKGVDTDAELQRLLVLEKSYAANARVIATVDTLMRTLLEI